MSNKIAMRVCIFVFAVWGATALPGATLIVGKAGTHCPHAKYTQIAAAIEAANAGDTIEICPALYAEQLTITKPLTLRGLVENGVGRVQIQPTTMSPAVSMDGAVGGLPVEAVITVANSHRVTVENLAIDARNNGVAGCAPMVAGIHYYNSSGVVKNNAIAGVQVTGCTGAGALLFGSGIGMMADADESGQFPVSVEQNSIHDFTRDGILATGGGVTARIDGNSISGKGPGGGVFQFGVFVLNDAVGVICNNLIHEGSCGALSADDCYAARTEGVTLRAVGDGTIVDHNIISTAQSGIFINGGRHVEISNNVITDIDLLDGMDIQGTAAGSFSESRIWNNTISNLGPVENQSCGIFEYTGTGVAGNVLLNNSVSDGYCGAGVVAADHIAHGSYYNTLFTEINSDLPTLPDPTEP